ncbi:hypothetical protein ACVK01_002367 [Paenibacillus sp. PvR148]
MAFSVFAADPRLSISVTALILINAIQHDKL